MPRSRGRLPQLGASRPSNLPASPEEHIDIRDLTWDDRERVLRLLFAKINNSATQKPMPHHALTQPGPAAGMPRGMVDATLLQYPPTGESGSVGGYSQSQASPDLPLPHDDMAMFMTQPGVA